MEVSVKLTGAGVDGSISPGQGMTKLHVFCINFPPWDPKSSRSYCHQGEGPWHCRRQIVKVSNSCKKARSTLFFTFRAYMHHRISRHLAVVLSLIRACS